MAVTLTRTLPKLIQQLLLQQKLFLLPSALFAPVLFLFFLLRPRRCYLLLINLAIRSLVFLVRFFWTHLENFVGVLGRLLHRWSGFVNCFASVLRLLIWLPRSKQTRHGFGISWNRWWRTEYLVGRCRRIYRKWIRIEQWLYQFFPFLVSSFWYEACSLHVILMFV